MWKQGQLISSRAISRTKEEALSIARMKDPTWIEDNAISECFLCGTQFSMTTRKHHCRSCGQIICSECCLKRIELPGHKKLKKVCDDCYVIRNALLIDPERRRE